MLGLERSTDDDEFFRALIFPEEDRALFTTAAWSGGFRWFKSSNVVCIEKYRRAGAAVAPPNGTERSCPVQAEVTALQRRPLVRSSDIPSLLGLLI